MVKMPDLSKLNGWEDHCLLAYRLLIGAFLVWGVWDNIVSPARMAEFAHFLEAHGFAFSSFMARLSVWSQFACGLAFVTGILVRWAGLLCALNFVVAIVMVDGPLGIRASFPSAVLIGFGLYMAVRGPGHFALARR